MLRWFVILTKTIVTFVILSNISANFYATAEIIRLSASVSMTDELQEMLNTEKVLIDILRHYIGTQEQKLSFLKRKTFEIRNIHDGITDREIYLYNPINALTIIKRFTADWRSLKSFAEDYLETDDIIKNYTQQMETLSFPSDEDYDAALINLLRIQDLYQLEPQRLAVGEINGVKLGLAKNVRWDVSHLTQIQVRSKLCRSEMTWSDCLEIGLKSSENGYQTYAKYWMETALEKLSNIDTTNTSNTTFSFNNSATATKEEHKSPPQDDYILKAKLEILKALLNTEYKLGNLEKALKLTNELLKLLPEQKNVIKAKNRIQKKLKEISPLKKNEKNIRNDKKHNVKINKTIEESTVGQICREASSLQTNNQIHLVSATTTFSGNPPTATHTASCSFITNNLPFLLIMPLKVELLSTNPYIVIYHNVLSDTQVEELRDFIVEKQDGTFEFTKIGQKKMRQINGKLHYLLGNYGRDFCDDWQVEHFNFENLMIFKDNSVHHEIDRQAKLLFNLQQPLMGGSVIFPQLKLAINLPYGSMLYWSTLNEYHIHDNRSKYYVCPVLGGSQLTATISIKKI